MARYVVASPLPSGHGGWCVYDVATRTWAAMNLLTEDQAVAERDRLMEAARLEYERLRRTD